MKRVTFSEVARQDRRAIVAVTVERFGLTQARRLRQEFGRVIERLLAFPNSGAKRPELDPPGRSFRYVVVSRGFVVAYEWSDDGLFTVRILHGARHLARELDSEQDEP